MTQDNDCRPTTRSVGAQGHLMEPTANFDRERIPYGYIRRLGCSPLATRGSSLGPYRSPVERTASVRPYSTKNDTDAVVRAEIGSISNRAVIRFPWDAHDNGAIFRRIQRAGSPSRVQRRGTSTTIVSSGDPAAGRSSSTVRSGVMARATRSTEPRFIYPVSLSRVCRGHSGLVRRLKRAPSMRHERRQHDLGIKQPLSEGNNRETKEKDPRV